MSTYIGPATVPSPRTWSPGDRLTAYRLTSDIAGAIDFLGRRPFFSGYQTSAVAQSIPTSTATSVLLDAEVTDNWGGHSLTTNTSRYVAPVAGWYLCTGQTPFAYTASSNLYVHIASIRATVGGTTTTYEGGKIPGASGHQPNPVCAELVQLNAGDYVELGCWQDTGASQTLVNGTKSASLTVQWVAATSGTTGLPVPSPAAWPSPPSYITAAWMNTNVRDVIRYLTYPPIFRAYYNGSSNTQPSQTWPSGTAIAMDTVTVDNYGGWSSSTPTQYTFQRPGHYFVYGQMAVTASTAGSRGAGLRVNGGTVQWGGHEMPCAGSVTPGHTSVVQRILKVAQGDYVELIGFQNSGSALAYRTGASTCKLIAVWLGA